jgi:uroporphyrinogen-III synthase
MQVAAEMNLQDAVRSSFARIVIGSIGPVTSEELREQGLSPDFEPSRPKMGFLVNEAAQQSTVLLQQKRG